MKPKYKKHIFICTNDRGPDHPRGDCANCGGKEIRMRFVQLINQYGLKQTNEEYINNLYENILSRPPDIAGQTYWENQLNNGFEDKLRVLIGFAESEENKSIFSREVDF